MQENFEGVVESIMSGGDGVCRIHSKSILIPNTVAGDKIRFSTQQKKHGIERGTLLEVLTPSKDRVIPSCKVAFECGGCALQAMSQQTQATLKSTWVRKAFKPFITDATEMISLGAHPAGYAGRRRVRWFIENNKLGFRKRYTHDLVHTDTCIALSQPLDELRNNLESLNIPAHVQSIQAVELSNGKHAIFESEQNQPEDFQPSLTQDFQLWWRTLNTPSTKPIHKPVQLMFDTIDLKPFLPKSIDIQIGANDFVQGHQQGNQQLISQILAWSKGSKYIVDFFSGCGNLSLPIAAAFDAKVIGAELNANSVNAANKNAKRLNLDASYQTMNLFESFDTQSFIGADTLILDPPRKGAQHICKNIQHLFPKQIIMVHCDVASASRDAKLLNTAGFKLKALRPLDLFPYAGHVESLSLWSS